MAVVSSPKTLQSNTLHQVQDLVPGVSLEAKSTFYWSPETNIIGYCLDELNSPEGIWSLIHEVAHARLSHRSYRTDFELLKLEVAAWEEAKKLATDLSVDIHEDHVQDCLDTYRDWLHKRSTCPTCASVGLQQTATEYHCHNCNSIWTVTAARFCRPYRRKKLNAKEKSPHSIKSQTTFQ